MELSAFYIFLLTVTLLGILFMFAAKGETISLVMSLVMAFAGVFYGFLTYQNEVMASVYSLIFAICFGSLAILGIIALFLARDSVFPKILITISALGGFLGCGALNAILSLF